MHHKSEKNTTHTSSPLTYKPYNIDNKYKQTAFNYKCNTHMKTLKNNVTLAHIKQNIKCIHTATVITIPLHIFFSFNLR